VCNSLIEMAVHRFPDLFSTDESQRALLSRVSVCSELQCSSLLSRLSTFRRTLILIDTNEAINWARFLVLSCF